MHNPLEIWHYADERGLPPEARLLIVEIDLQRMRVLHQARQIREYGISTSRFGPGQAADSHQTPTGFHEVADRIGDGATLGQVFDSREPANLVLMRSAWNDDSDADLILTRILRLRGLDPGHNLGVNIDSYDRYIYIHGTNQEHRLGSPASHGCIRMANDDIAELFTLLRDHPAWCWIG